MKSFVKILVFLVTVLRLSQEAQSREYKLPPVIEEALAELENSISGRTAASGNYNTLIIDLKIYFIFRFRLPD